MEKNFTARLADLKEIAQNTYEATFDFGKQNFEFSPGQYIWVNLPKLLYDDPRGARRAFSISSSPDNKTSVEIIFRLGKSGFKKTLVDKRTIGKKVEIIGPLGSFGVPENANKELVFIAGGVGVAPYVSILRHIADNGLKNKITLFFSNSTLEKSFYTKLFDDLATKNPNFKFVNNIGKLKISVIKQNIDNIKNKIFFVTGNKNFVVDISSALLSLGVPKENFVFGEHNGFLSGTKKEQNSSESYEVSLKEFRTAVVDVADHIVITDTNGLIRYANPAAEKITGYTFEEMKGSTPRLWGGLMDKEFYEKLWKTIKVEKKTFESELQNRRKTGQIYYALVRISPVLDDKGELTGFVATEQDITKIKELDKMKDDFLSMASHELRTPLTAIDGIISMLREGEYGKINKNVKLALNDVNESSTRLIKLVNDLLNLSRIQAGRLKYNLSSFNISIPLNNVTNLFKPSIKEKGLEFKISGAVSANVQADQDKVEQVLTNLLSNSLKFTQKGEISIKVSEEGEFVKVTLSNTGESISKEDQELLFGKFQQVGAQKQRPQGTGLGLHISREMVRKMGGEIWLVKSEPDDGSVFAFTLPKDGSHPAKKASDDIQKEMKEHPDQKSDTLKKT